MPKVTTDARDARMVSLGTGAEGADWVPMSDIARGNGPVDLGTARTVSAYLAQNSLTADTDVDVRSLGTIVFGVTLSSGSLTIQGRVADTATLRPLALIDQSGNLIVSGVITASGIYTALASPGFVRWTNSGAASNVTVNLIAKA